MTSSDDAIENPAETGPFLYTFTFRLPLVLGIRSGFEVTVETTPYATESDAAIFLRPPSVRIRFINRDIADHKFLPANMAGTLAEFYGSESSGTDTLNVGEVIQLYEQWVSLETPAALLRGENAADGAYAFHRGLACLNLFLASYGLARWDNSMRPISSRELRPVVMIGRLDLENHWEENGLMLMHPDAHDRVPLSVAAIEARLAVTTDAILHQKPFVNTFQWQARAERRKYEGDSADAIVSFQVAAETLLYELWALLLHDEGIAEAEIDSRRAQLPFASLIKRELAQFLGGSWDVTDTARPVGHYWTNLYLLRNRITHGGYQPHDGDAEAAERAFFGLHEFLDDRLNAVSSSYPGAAAAKLTASYLEPPVSDVELSPGVVHP
jgi:hypothetical protein